VITRNAPFLLGFLQTFGQVAPCAELFIDIEHISFVYNLPYVSRVGQLLDFKNKFIISFDPRYNPHEAWGELSRELTVQTATVDLDFRWEQGWSLSESEYDDDYDE
jgi:hypothetical protein